jgi:autotransporter-associated beta strand protein
LNDYLEDFRFYNGAGDANFVESVRALQAPVPLYIAQQPQNVYIPSGQNATFTVNATGDPAPTSYQWYEVIGGATNLIGGATLSSYTISGATASDSFFVVVGNGSTTVTSSVAGLNISVDGIWNTSSGSWNTAGNWVGNAIASGGGTASFLNGLGGTVTLDNAAGFTVGMNIIGVAGATTVQPSWVINSGSPAGTLTMADNGTASVVSGSSAPTVTAVPVITVYPNNPVTINAPLAGNQGLYVNGGGTLVLAANNTYSGTTVIGANTSDTTSLQIGSGGTSGAIDFINPIYLSGFAELIFNRSDTLTVSSYFMCQAGKAPNLVVNSGKVILAPTINSPSSWLGAIVNSGGTLVLDCPAGVYSIHNSGGTVNITDGTPQSATIGNNSGGVSLGINSGGIVQLAGPGGNGVNIQNDGEGMLDNGVFDLGGDAIQVGFIAGTGIVTNSGATLATLTLMGNANGLAFPWNGTIADGTTAKTAVTLSAGTTVFSGANTYTGDTILSGALLLTNSASLATPNIRVTGANLILANTATINNAGATIYVGSGRTVDLTGLAGNFTLNAGQTLVVTNRA